MSETAIEGRQPEVGGPGAAATAEGRLRALVETLERRLRKGDEQRRAMLHIVGDLNESNKHLANQRKAMLHILADYEEDRRRLSRQTERLDNSRRLTTSLAGLAQGQAAPGGQPQGHDSHHGGPAGNHGRNAAT